MSTSELITSAESSPRTDWVPSDPSAAVGAPSKLGGLALTALAVTAVVHIPVAVQHLTEVPYLGVAFYAFVVLCATGLGSLLVQETPLVWAGVGLLNLGAVIAFLLSRAVGLPGASDDKGDWSNQTGIVAVVAELIVVAVAALVVHRNRRPADTWLR